VASASAQVIAMATGLTEPRCSLLERTIPLKISKP